MGRPKLIAVLAVVGVLLGACSSDSKSSTSTASTVAATTTSGATTSTTAPSTTSAPSTTAAPATVAPTSDVPTTAAPTTPATTATTGATTTAAPTTVAPAPPPPGTVAPAGGTKTIIDVAGFLVPQGDYSFEDAPADTVANFQTLLAASPVIAPQDGTIGGVDVFDNAGTNLGRVFIFVPDDPLPPGSVEDLAPFLAGGLPTSPGTVDGIAGIGWTSGTTSFFVGAQDDTLGWAITSSPANLEPALGHLFESLGG
jgi:hypothetical protein